MAEREGRGETIESGPGGGVEPATRDLTGLVLSDFRIERLLGHGGMGEVYLARQISLDRPVALKVLRPELLSNPTYMARFESEAWAAARLNHPNIVHIYTLGGVGSLKFIAMEYVQGTNLREYLARKGVPELPLALSIMKQATRAVGAAGELGLVHRDIKPENLLLTPKGQVKVADFGLCRGPDGSSPNLTATGVALGTPMYMSPEQVQGHPLSHRSDLYSLGVTFYHMLAGEPPFRAESPLAVALKHVREKPVSLAVHRPDLPPGLVALVMRLLEKDPAQRYASAAEVLADLARVREAAQVGAATEAVAAPVVAAGISTRIGPAEVAAGSDAGPPAAASGWGGPRIGMGVLLVLVPLAFGAGAAWGWMGRTPDLLAPTASPADGLPGLWMEPWRGVPVYRTAQAQYRYAQTQADAAIRPAAWLAVPGRFPTARDLVFRSYVQFARDLFRRGDGERLGLLAVELTASPERADSERWVSLSRVTRAAAELLEDDVPGLLDEFRRIPNLALMDPGVAEMGLEVVRAARRRPSSGGAQAVPLSKLQSDLLEPLQLDIPPRLGLEALD